MLRWFLMLMIALLPLRGWVGSAMAHEPGTGVTMAVQAHVAQAHAADADAAAHEDCMGHEAAAPAADAAPESDSAGFACPTCADCQACSAVGLATAAASLIPLSFDRPQPAAPVVGFASADPAPGFKPPIS